MSMDHLIFDENAVKHNPFFYDIDIEDGDIVGELAKRNLEMYDNSINLLHHNNHVFYGNDINTFLK